MFLSDMCVVSGNEGEVKAYAKLNLTLDVTGKREDGYHDILTIMRTVSLYDTVSVKLTEDAGISLTTNLSWLPTDEGNIAYRAAAAVIKESGIYSGVKIHIDKKIPCGAGMGGGSADGAGVIVLLNRLLGSPLDDEKLLSIGASIGADVPFCMVGGTCIAEGIGEKLTTICAKGLIPTVVIKPQVSISTAAMYNTIDNCEITNKPDTQTMKNALISGNIKEIADRLVNVMEPPAVAQHPEIEEVKNQLLSMGALGAMMTGSGSAVFGIFESHSNAHKCHKEMLKKYKEVYSISMI